MRLKALVLLGVFCAAQVWAKPAKDDDSNLQGEGNRTVTVAVPQSEIALEPIRFKPPRPVEFEFGVSSYEPTSFARATYAGGSSTFGRGEVPQVTINRLGELLKWSNGLAVSSKLGVSYMNLQRSSATSFDDGISGGSDTQSMNLFIGRVGAELAWRNLLPWGIEPNLSLTVAPTWAMSGESAQEASVNAVGFPFEGTAGVLWRISHAEGPGRGDISVGVEAQAMRGSVGGSSMNGSGVGGLMRVSL